MCNFFEWGTYGDRRQDLESWFHDDGNVVILKSSLVKKAEKLEDVWGKKRERVIIDKEQNFEIDGEFDFWMNEQILRKRNENKK